MHLSGQTPLFRAKNLEKYLGIESIYLKLEGANPTGHKNDRIAEALCKYAKTKGYEKLLIHGSERYYKSIIYFADYLELECYGQVIKSDLNISKKKQFQNINWIDIKIKKNEDEVTQIENYAKENGMFLLSEWEKKPFIRSLAIQSIMEEISQKLKSPTSVWSQAKGGYTVMSLYHQIMRSWIDEDIDTMPELHCGVSKLVVDKMSDTPQNQPKFKEILEGMQSIMANTETIIHSIEEEKLTEAVKLIKKLENVTISKNEAYSLAAFLASEHKEGTHVILLNDGRSDIEIKEISKLPDIDMEEIVKCTRELLQPYHDSYEETIDAVKKAVKLGYIFTAKRNNKIEGICIIVHMGFEDFIPTYHLAYIGVKSGNAGRGVATSLINAAVDKTGGKMSLHVDIPNKRAKKLYEKMGFVHCYDRMLYKG